MNGSFELKIMSGLVGILALEGCAANIDVNEGNLIYGQSGAPSSYVPSPKRPPFHPQNIARISVLDTNVLKWSEIAQDLQAAQFTYTGNSLYDMSVANTSTTSNVYVDQFLAKVSAELSGAQRDFSKETSTDAAGNTTTTSDRKSALKTPTPADYSLAVSPPPTITSGVQGATSGIETLTRLQEAAALAEEIAILNKRVSGLALPRGYVPYFVSFQIGVNPAAHGLPYDTTIHLQFDPKGFSITDLAQERDEKPAALAHVGDGNVTEGCKTAFTGVEVMPLLVTDSLESTNETDVADVVRQLGGAIKVSGGPFGGSGQLERAITKLNQSQASRLNSLLSVTRETRSCIAVRFGANRYGNAFEMVARNHNVSVVLLVPVAHVKDSAWLNTEFRTPQIQVSGTAEFNDPVWYLKGRPFPDPNPVTVTPDFVNLPLIDTPTCPPLQEAILTSAVAPNVVQAPELDKSVVILSASRGIDLSSVTAQLITPTALSGERLALATQDVSSIRPGELRFQFPAQSGLFKAAGSGRVEAGFLRFSVATDRHLAQGTTDQSGRNLIFCPSTWNGGDTLHDRSTLERTSYRIAYIIPGAPKPAKSPAKSTAGTKGSAPKSSSGTPVTPANSETPETSSGGNVAGPSTPGKMVPESGPKVTLPL